MLYSLFAGVGLAVATSGGFADADGDVWSLELDGLGLRACAISDWLGDRCLLASGSGSAAPGGSGIPGRCAVKLADGEAASGDWAASGRLIAGFVIL